MRTVKELDKELIELQNAKDEYLAKHREKVAKLNDQYNEAVEREKAEAADAQAIEADSIESEENVGA